MHHRPAPFLATLNEYRFRAGFASTSDSERRLQRWAPGLATLVAYRPEWLLKDLAQAWC